MSRGGEYKTQGADTCVYIPHVACSTKGTAIRAADRGTEFVSRIVPNKYEVTVQKAVVKALDANAIKGVGLSNFFNLADSACAPKFKPEDKKERCTVDDLQDNQGLINLVTPVQGDTLFRSILAKSKPDALIKSSLKGLMLAMVQLNAEKVTHSDSHFNNLGWMGDQLVIFDWGRGTVGLEPFKAWVRRYLSWNKAKQEEWKRLSQHTLQFSLLDLYPAQLTVMSSKGLFTAIMSVWDTLGLLGPARAAGVVSEEKAKAFADEIFKSIKEKKQSLTEKLLVMIPALFGDPPAIHPIVAEKPMPPAEAKAVSRIIPVESSVVEVKAAPAAPVAADRKLEDMKDACRKLLAPGGGRRRTFRRRKHRGGVFKAVGTGAITLEAHDASWNFLPPAVGGTAKLAQVIASIPGYTPATVVAHISTYPDIAKKHDLIRNSRYAPHALTYIAAYPCDIVAFLNLPEDEWAKHFPASAQPGETIGGILKNAEKRFLHDGTPCLCLIIPKFEKTVTDMPIVGGINAMLEILTGLCVEKKFIIDDLHLDNMAVMSDGRAVTFDYDKVRTYKEFGGLFTKILESPSMYLQLPQYQHVMKLGPRKVMTLAESEEPDINFFVNYDLLSVLSSLKFICSELYVAGPAAEVDKCMQGISAIRDPNASRAPIVAELVQKLPKLLGGVKDDRSFSEILMGFQADSALENAWKARDEAEMEHGGARRRTFRRKHHQKGGDYLAGGEDTLVWDRKPTADKPWLGLPIAYDGTTLSIPPGFGTLTKYGDPVVRMVLLRAGEMGFHRALKEWSALPENEFVKMHLNTFAGNNGVYSTHPDVVLGKFDSVTRPEAIANPEIKAALEHEYFPGDDREADVEGLAAGSGKWYGLITRRQGEDIKKLAPDPAIRALVTLTQPLLRTDGFWISYDLHDGNMAQMIDGTPVIHDYGRMKFRDYDLIKLKASTPSFPWHGNTNILRNVIPLIVERPEYYETFRQFYYVTQLITALSTKKDITERKTDIKDRLNDSCYNPDEAGAAAAAESYKIKGRRAGLERKLLKDMVYIATGMASRGSLYKTDPEQDRKDGRMREIPLTVAEVNAELAGKDDAGKEAYLKSLWKDPVYETRYHHLARIWDLLAVLKAVGTHAEKAHAARPPTAPPDADYGNVAVLSRGTARKLMQLVKADPFPFAIRDQVKKIVNKFCVGAIALLKGDPKNFTPMSEVEQDAAAKTYWETTNEARTGPAPVAAPAPAATSGGDDSDDELTKLGAEPDKQLVEPEKPSPDREADPEKEILRGEAETEAAVAAAFPPPVAAAPPPPRGGKLTRRRRLPRLY